MDSRGSRFAACGRLKGWAAPKERLLTPILQAWRLGGLDAWMPGGLESGGSDPAALEAGWLACWLAGRLGLDWSGYYIGIGGVGRGFTRSTLREVGGYCRAQGACFVGIEWASSHTQKYT